MFKFLKAIFNSGVKVGTVAEKSLNKIERFIDLADGELDLLEAKQRRRMAEELQVVEESFKQLELS